MDTHMYWIFLRVFRKTMVGWSVRWFPSHVWWHRRVYDMYMICIWYVYDMYETYDMYMIRIWILISYVYIISIISVWNTLVPCWDDSIEHQSRTAHVRHAAFQAQAKFFHPWASALVAEVQQICQDEEVWEKRGQKRAFVGHFNRFPFGPWKDPSLYPLVI